MARCIAVTHHERWDGCGYPRQLKGEETSIEGRIVAIADVFDALTSKRPYKEAWPVNKALQYLQKEAGTLFDSHLIARFMGVLDKINIIKERLADKAAALAPEYQQNAQERDAN